ncbi:hypothetical protein SNEBB_010950 [Seison nebaliae]|nr:hypothetical protein SNEBB_010950 [Seison nebaliae]
MRYLLNGKIRKKFRERKIDYNDDSIDEEELKELLNESSKSIFNLLDGAVVAGEKVEWKNCELRRRRRCRLTKLLEESEYQRIISNVNVNVASGKSHHQNPFQSINQQMITILNVFLTIFGSGFFAFHLSRWIFEIQTSIAIIVGFIVSLIVAMADIYFLLKYLINSENDQLKSNNSKIVLDEIYQNVNYEEQCCRECLDCVNYQKQIHTLKYL